MPHLICGENGWSAHAIVSGSLVLKHSSPTCRPPAVCHDNQTGRNTIVVPVVDLPVAGVSNFKYLPSGHLEVFPTATTPRNTSPSVWLAMVDGLGSRALIIGGNRGLGLEVSRHVASLGLEVAVTCRTPNDHVSTIDGKVHVVPGIDVADREAPEKVCTALKELGWTSCDTVICVAGLFTTDTLEDLKPEKNVLMYEVCALGPLRLISKLVTEKLLVEGSKVGLITSEGGSIGLRTEKEGGNNYGHRMSKCAENMMGRILSFDLKPRGIAVVCIHPGFLKTTMTEHYSEAYDKLGAVFPQEAAPPIVETVRRLTVDTTGRFVAPLGSASLGFGIYALDKPESLRPFSELPW